MERLQAINSGRIEWCCNDYDIAPDDLFSELGISNASMERVMAGEAGLTFNQLRKMADFFGRGVLFFMETSPVDEKKVHTTQFRTLSNQKPELTISIKKLIERVEQQRAVYQSLLEDLDEADQPQFNPPPLPRTPQAAASVVRAWLNLSDENNFDTYRAAVEAQGILVFRSNGYNGKWHIPKTSPIFGFTLYDPICPVIVIKKERSEARQSFTLMHELGHLLLHKTSSIDDVSDLHSHQGRECAANAFAGNVLVPHEFLLSIFDAERPNEVSRYDAWLEQHQRVWGISCEVILRRLLDAGRLPQEHYRDYRQWCATRTIPEKTGGTRKYRYREPRHVFGDTYVKTVLDSLNARHITLAKASRYLDSLKIQDLHHLENFYAGSCMKFIEFIKRADAVFR